MVVISLAASAQSTAGNVVSGSVAVHEKSGAVQDSSGAVVWLTPKAGPDPAPAPAGTFQLVQHNKKFTPHLLVVPIDSIVEFPNRDDFFHNVFSVYEGTRFDLGLYESGSSKKVRFSRPGPSYIFCNIHPSMSAVIVVMKSPYYSVTNAKGQYSIDGVPDGEYTLNVWFERAKPEQLRQLSRTVTVSGNLQVPAISINETPSLAAGHKNKYGQDYEQPERQPY
jgi:plastocyanin